MSTPDELDAPAVIFDSGSGFSKAGLSGDIVPRKIFNSVVGYPKSNISLGGRNRGRYFVGKEAQNNVGSLYLHHPVERGLVTRWDDMEKLWKHLFERELGVDPKEQPVLLTEASLNPREARERIAEIMFETFNVPALYLSNHAVATLFASACDTGLVVDSGDQVTCAVPVFGGLAVPQAVTKLSLGGRQITEHLLWHFLDRDCTYPCVLNRAVLDDVKEKLCYIPWCSEKESYKRRLEVPRDYTLPDGHVIHMEEHLCQAPEALFCPQKLGIQDLGLSEMVYDSILKCDTDMQQRMFAGIVLSGGSTLFPGLEERLLGELKQLTGQGTFINISDPPDRCFSAWKGASIMASMSAFKQMWATSDEFKEFGKSVVNFKCY
ncbi:actin-related protein T1-like [Ctenodactylus gundi]